jgi:hypothetical protein
MQDLLNYITAIGSMATPILVLILTGVGWTIRKRVERAYKMEEKLRDDRIDVYNKILEPFIISLAPSEAFKNTEEYEGKPKNEIVVKKITSLDYKQNAFKLALMGSDNVVKAYNDLMQFFYQKQNNKKEDSEEIMNLLGNFLLEIRKSVGNEKTSLSNLEMLEGMITDIRKFK